MLFSRAVERRLQFRPLLIPSGLFGVRLAVERGTRCCDLFGLALVDSFGLFKCRYRLCDRLTATLPSCLLPAALAVAPLLVPRVGDRCRAGGFVVDLASRPCRRKLRRRLSLRRCYFSDGELLGEPRVFAKTGVRADAALQDDAGLGHRGSDDRWIVRFFRKTLVEKIGLCAPGFQSGFH